MNIHDLMIGDWVNFLIDIEGGDTEYDPENEIYQPMQVDSVSALDEVTSAFFGVINSVAQLQPIPLTAEILEKNGFVKMSKSPYVMLYMWSTGGVAEFADVTIQVGQDHADKWRWDCLTLKIHLYRGDITLHKIRYIHELQHALRLCGIEKEIEV